MNDRERDLPLHLTIAAVGLAAMLIAASALQLRPFRWNTNDLEPSMTGFNDLHNLMLTGQWLRAFVALPLVYLAVTLRLYLGDRPALYVRLAEVALVCAAILSVASGWIGATIGVPTEEYVLGAPEARALEVQADATYWQQDNLLTMANLAAAVGATLFALAMSRGNRGFPTWSIVAGVATLPCVFLATTSFYIPASSGNLYRAEQWMYATGVGAAGLCLFIWLAGVVLTARRGDVRT
jgi:hypothetical protein